MVATWEPAPRVLRAGQVQWAMDVSKCVCPDRLRADVERLPAPRSRLHHPEAIDGAANMIADAFAAAGWRAEHCAYELSDAAGYLDYAEEGEKGFGRTVYPHLRGVNVLGVKPGVSSTDAVVVGGHYDTIRDSPGANDNGAAVAATMELARTLGACRFRDTVILAAFDMEEIGLLGSRAFVEAQSARRRITGAIVYETMGYTDSAAGSQASLRGMGAIFPRQVGRVRRRGFAGDWTAVLYRRAALDLARSFAGGLSFAAGPDASILWRDPLDVPVAGPVLRRLVPALRHFSRSDHCSFWDAGLPAIMVTDTANLRYPHYHKETDTAEKLDYERLRAIVCASAVAVAEAAGLEGWER